MAFSDVAWLAAALATVVFFSESTFSTGANHPLMALQSTSSAEGPPCAAQVSGTGDVAHTSGSSEASAEACDRRSSLTSPGAAS